MTDDDRFTFEDNSVDDWRRGAEQAALNELETAREAFLTAARAAAQKIPAQFLSKWNLRSKKDDQSAPEVIERFVEIAADGFNDLLDHEEVERSKNIVETGRDE